MRAAAAITILVLLQGGYATYRSRRFYQSHTPFFDSCSYTNQLAEVYAVARTQGVAAGWKNATTNRNVALPWLVAAVLAPLVPLSRELGTWMQTAWLLWLGLALGWYFVRCRGADAWLAVTLTLPFLSFGGIYCVDGGLADFRMDLPLYILLAAAGAWYLAACSLPSAVPWLLCGVSAMLACLTRATAVAYLAAMFGPPWGLRLLRASGAERRALLAGLPWLLAPPLAAVSVFLGHSYRYLYQYYFVWSPDATAHLPPWRSAIHLALGLAHIGVPLAAASVAVLGILLWVERPAAKVSAAAWLARLDWEILYLGLAPVLLLAALGAGPNPYVSMPAVFGFLSFSYVPYRGISLAALRPPARRAVCALLLGACAFNATTAGGKHLLEQPHLAGMAAVRSILDSIRADAARRGLREVAFVNTYIGELNNSMLRNILIYEYGGMPAGGGIADPSGMRFGGAADLAFSAASPGEWARNVPGATDEQKLSDLVRTALERVDYVLLPDEATLRYLESRVGFVYLNGKARELRRRILATGRWTPLGEPVALSPHETVRIYRKEPGPEPQPRRASSSRLRRPV